MGKTKATDLSRAELVKMVVDLRRLLERLPLDTNVDVEMWSAAQDELLRDTAFDNDQTGQEFQCLVPSTQECPFHHRVAPGYGLPDTQECGFRKTHVGAACSGLDSAQCPLNVFAEIRVRREK